MQRLARSSAAIALMAVSLVGVQTHAAINYSIAFDDPTSALNATVRPLLESHAIAAGERWAKYLVGDADVEVVIRPNAAIPFAEGRSVTSSFVENNGTFDVFEQGMTAELRTGVDPNGAEYDVLIEINPAYVYDELWFDPDPVARTAVVDVNRTDAMSTFIHEFGHALGFNGWINATTGTYPGNYQSTYDEQINFDGQNFFATGPAATALYGAPVPLTFGNASHVANFSPRPGEDLILDVMNGLVFYRGSRYEISPLDLAILNDAGVPTFYLAGDYDDDRDVDGADFLMWQQQLGTAVLKNTAADGNNDGFVDAADLAVWQADFGEHFSGAVAATTPIPEPTATVLAAFSVSCLVVRRVRIATLAKRDARSQRQRR
ncbi:MAG: hypothetical protein C0485_04910 [Pirellula sp.]|nr:hypothetical protein [Pirellula sp.]